MSTDTVFLESDLSTPSTCTPQCGGSLYFTAACNW